MIGRTYQADVPEGLCKYDDALPYENEDKLLWDPQQLSNKELEEYLTKALEPLISSAQGIAMIPVGSHIKDDEQVNPKKHDQYQSKLVLLMFPQKSIKSKITIRRKIKPKKSIFKKIALKKKKLIIRESIVPIVFLKFSPHWVLSLIVPWIDAMPMAPLIFRK